MNKMLMLFGQSALVLKEAEFNQETGSVRLVGRKSGLIAWILNLLKMGYESEFSVSKECIKLVGAGNHFFPVATCSNVMHGFSKPWWFLGLAIILLFSGFVADDAWPRIWLTVGALVSFLLYYYGGKLFIIVSANSGDSICFVFKENSVAGLRNSHEICQKTAATIAENIIDKHQDSK